MKRKNIVRHVRTPNPMCYMLLQEFKGGRCEKVLLTLPITFRIIIIIIVVRTSHVIGSAEFCVVLRKLM